MGNAGVYTVLMRYGWSLVVVVGVGPGVEDLAVSADWGK